MVLCWICLAVIGIIFYHYDGEPLPRWPLGFDLNSVANIPGKFIEGSIASVIYPVMCQLSYLWFRKPRPIQDAATFPAAGLSVHKAPLIWRAQRCWGLASLLALCFVVSLAITTNVQQAISVKIILVSYGTGTVPISTRISRPQSSTSSFANIDTQLLVTIEAGFMGQGDQVQNIEATCAGANECSWDIYKTLTTSYHCEDLSSSIVPSCLDPPGSECSFQLPLKSGDMTVSSDQRYSSIAYLNDDFMQNITWPYAAWIVMATAGNGNRSAVAKQCKLYSTIISYASSWINGSFEERAVGEPWLNHTELFIENPEWIMQNFSISGISAVSRQKFFLDYFTANSTETVAGVDFGGQHQHQVQYDSLLAGTHESNVLNLSSAMTKMDRMSTPIDGLYKSSIIPATNATCLSLRQEERVHIYWVWLIPAVFTIIFTSLVFAITVIVTHKSGIGIHNSSVLALLNSSLSDASRLALHRDTGSWDLRRGVRANAIFRRDRHGTYRFAYQGRGRSSSPSLFQWLRTATPTMVQRLNTAFRGSAHEKEPVDEGTMKGLRGHVGVASSSSTIAQTDNQVERGANQ
ncbi:MAG: hypothetical protein Q9175_004678 [Cornicularia normoerica]